MSENLEKFIDEKIKEKRNLDKIIHIFIESLEKKYPIKDVLTTLIKEIANLVNENPSALEIIAKEIEDMDLREYLV